MTVTGSKLQVFKYQPPQSERPKEIIWLARTDIVLSAVQVVREGGENNLHSHNNMDGFWMVLEGRARFYGAGNELIAEVGKYEGVLVPRETPYWFESSGAEPLQLLQVEALLPGVKEVRTNFEPINPAAMVGESGTGEIPQT